MTFGWIHQHLYIDTLLVKESNYIFAPFGSTEPAGLDRLKKGALTVGKTPNTLQNEDVRKKIFLIQ